MKFKTKMLAASLFLFTTATVAYYPSLQQLTEQQRPLTNPSSMTPKHNNIEVVFVLDTTGSMSGMIDAAKEKIWSIASTMASTQNNTNIKIGLVAYRDRGDEYITRSFDLSTDLDSLYAQLMDFQAAGGGDGPESVNQALYTAVNDMSWSPDQEAYKVVFLVGDAPPHMDYQDEVKYPTIINRATDAGIVVNTIQCGQNRATKTQWKEIAQIAGGTYLQVEQTGSAIAITTPFDRRLAALSTKLDETKIYYGSKEQKNAQQLKLTATKKLHAQSSVESQARRAEFNVSTAGSENFLGEGELVDDIDRGAITLETISKDQLPAALQAMAPAEQKKIIKEKAASRSTLKKEIRELARQRSEFLREEMDKTGKAKASLDYKIFSTVRDQAKAKGIDYEPEAIKY